MGIRDGIISYEKEGVLIQSIFAAFLNKILCAIAR